MDVNSTAPEMPKPAQLITASILVSFLDDLLHSGVDRIFIGHIDRQMGNTLHRDISAAELIDDAAILFQSGCRAPSDAGASAGNNNDLVVFSRHDFPPENVDLVRVYRIAR